MKTNAFTLEDIDKIVLLVPLDNNVGRRTPLSEQVFSCKIEKIGTRYVQLEEQSDGYRRQIKVKKSPIGHGYFKDDGINSGYHIFYTEKDCNDFFDRKRMVSTIITEMSSFSGKHKEIPVELLKPLYDYIKSNQN